jgi:hypothetical protein
VLTCPSFHRSTVFAFARRDSSQPSRMQ